MVIPMYTTTTPHDPRRHKMRPQTYAIGHKVNSLLSEPSLSTCETRLLPQMYVLCMIRNQEEDHEAARSIGREGEESEQEKELPKSYSSRTSDDLRTTDDLQTSDAWRFHPPERLQPRHPTVPGRPPDAGCLTLVSQQTTDPVRISGATDPEPKRRKSDDFRTSGQPRATGRPEPTGRPVPVCAQCIGPKPMYPFRPSLTPSWP